MLSEIENYKCKLIRMERGVVEKYRFVFHVNNFGEWPVDIKEKHYHLFKLLNKYEIQTRIDNFDRIKNKKGNFWVDLSLEKILENDKVLWELDKSTSVEKK